MSSRHHGRLAAALLALLAAACSDAPAPLEQAPPAQGALVPGRDIIAVQNRYTPELMRRAGIIGTGIRLSETGAQKIAVYAVSPTHAAAARLPQQLEGYDVDVVVTGRIDAIDYNDPTTRERPAPNGFSVGHYAITAGTIGARVKDGTGQVYILSNNHVLANSNSGSIGDAIYQPGPYDGGTSADQIGTLAAFRTIVMGGGSNTMDAAIALVNAADLLGATPDYAFGAPGTSPVGATLNMAVQKFGRTTGHTTGTVAEVNVTLNVCYVPLGNFLCLQYATFTGQMGISPGTFSAGGDSGSLIVTNNSSRSPVGLLFAGSSTRTIANPIGPVLTYFGVSIDTGSGTEPPPPPPPGEDTTAPTAAFAYACSKTNCSFTDQSTDDVGVVSWSWNFDDGSPASDVRNPSHSYTAAGNYTVALLVADAAGNSGSTSHTIRCAVRGKQLRCN